MDKAKKDCNSMFEIGETIIENSKSVIHNLEELTKEEKLKFLTDVIDTCKENKCIFILNVIAVDILNTIAKSFDTKQLETTLELLVMMIDKCVENDYINVINTIEKYIFDSKKFEIAKRSELLVMMIDKCVENDYISVTNTITNHISESKKLKIEDKTELLNKIKKTKLNIKNNTINNLKNELFEEKKHFTKKSNCLYKNVPNEIKIEFDYVTQIQELEGAIFAISDKTNLSRKEYVKGEEN